MSMERRAHKRYVIDGLMVDIGGELHETVDVSIRAVAVVRRQGVDYGKLTKPSRFVSPKAKPLNRSIAKINRLYERPAVVVLDYIVDGKEWEQVLAAHDVRADVVPLEDLFE